MLKIITEDGKGWVGGEGSGGCEVLEKVKSVYAIYPASLASSVRLFCSRHRQASKGLPSLSTHIPHSHGDVLECAPACVVDALDHGLDLLARSKLMQLGLAFANHALDGRFPFHGFTQLPLEQRLDAQEVVRCAVKQLHSDNGPEHLSICPRLTFLTRKYPKQAIFSMSNWEHLVTR